MNSLDTCNVTIKQWLRISLIIVFGGDCQLLGRVVTVMAGHGLSNTSVFPVLTSSASRGLCACCPTSQELVCLILRYHMPDVPKKFFSVISENAFFFGPTGKF